MGLVQPFGGSSIPQLWIENMQTWSNGCAKTLRLAVQEVYHWIPNSKLTPCCFSGKSETKVDFTLHNWWICTVAGGWLEAFDSERTINRYIARGCQIANLTNCSFIRQSHEDPFPSSAGRSVFFLVEKKEHHGGYIFHIWSIWTFIAMVLDLFGAQKTTHIRQIFVGLLRTPLKPLLFVFANRVDSSKDLCERWCDIQLERALFYYSRFMV